MKATLLVASLLLAIPAHAQIAPRADRPASAVPLPLQVQRIAPQLVAFAGSQANFDNLVNGLAAGSPVTLTTVDPSGAAQTVTFTPAGGAVSSPVEIARSLEATRQRFIASGVATPNAQQLGTTLAGTDVPVTLSTPAATPGSGLVPGAAAAGGSLPSATEQIQSRPAAPRANTSDSPAAGNLSDSPAPANQPLPGPAITPPALEAAPPAPAQPGIRLDR